MVFKRRNPRSYVQTAAEFFYPRGGWSRAALYVYHRLRRLPDPPERVGRGVAAGIFISFTPFFGAHLVGAAALAWALGGNILAAALATFIGNPVTTPFIAVMSVTLGRWILGVPGQIGPQAIVSEIARATGEVGKNVLAVASERTADWTHLQAFFDDIFVGGILPGLITAVIGYYRTVPLMRAYQKRQADRAAVRLAKARAVRARREGAEGRQERVDQYPCPTPPVDDLRELWAAIDQIAGTGGDSAGDRTERDEPDRPPGQ